MRRPSLTAGVIRGFKIIAPELDAGALDVETKAEYDALRQAVDYMRSLVEWYETGDPSRRKASK